MFSIWASENHLQIAYLHFWLNIVKIYLNYRCNFLYQRDLEKISGFQVKTTLY